MEYYWHDQTTGSLGSISLRVSSGQECRFYGDGGVKPGQPGCGLASHSELKSNLIYHDPPTLVPSLVEDPDESYAPIVNRTPMKRASSPPF